VIAGKEEIAMKFVQIEAVAVRVQNPNGGQQHDELELFGLDEEGRVYRYGFSTGGWHELSK
jgi:hypothetical protein